MSNDDHPPRYRSYLLTTWEERGSGDDSPMVWRFTLESVRSTGQRHAFATLEEMMLYLKEEIENLA